MADEILIKVRADLDGFSADMQEAKKIGNSAIAEIEKKEIKPKIDVSEVERSSKSMAQSLDEVKRSASQIFRGDVLDGLRNLNQSIGEFKTGAAQAFSSVKTAGVSSLTAIRAALIATGIGAFAVAVGLIAANWDKIKLAVTGTNSAQKALNDLAQKNLESAKQKTKELNSQENTLRLQGKTEKEIRQLKLDQLNYQIKIAEIALRSSIDQANSQYKAEVRNKRILAGLIEFTSVPFLFVLKTIDTIAAKVGQQTNLAKDFSDKISSFVFDPAELKAEKDKEIEADKARLKDLKNTRDGLILDGREKEKEASNEAKDQKIKDEKEYDDYLDGRLDEAAEKQIKGWEEESKEKKRIEKEDAELEDKLDKEEYDRGKGIFVEWKDQAAEKAKIEKDNADARAKYEEDLLRKQKEALDQLLDFAQNGILITIGLNPNDVQRVRVSLEELKKTLDNSESTPAERAAKAAEVAGAAYQTVSNSIFAADTQRRQEELAALQGQQEEELRLAGDNEQKKDIIRQKYALKEKDIKRKQAEADKRKAIMDATINTAVAVIKAISQSPLTLGMPWAAIVAALGAAQIALIAATPIPKFAKGVVSFDGKGGLVKGEGTGTSDSNLAYLSKGESVIPAEPTSANLGLINELVNGDVDEYVNRHYVLPALKSQEIKAKEYYKSSQIEAENNLIARVSSHTLKSIHREQKNTTEAIKRLDKKDFKW